MIQLDAKKLARFERVGHRITENRRQTNPVGQLRESARRSVTQQAWATWMYSKKYKRRRLLASWPVRSAGFLSRKSIAGEYFRPMGPHTAPVNGKSLQ